MIPWMVCVSRPNHHAKRVSFLLCLALSLFLGQPFPAKAKPNLIYVVCDDLGYGDLGCYGQKVVKTPRFDRMAEEGLRFTDHYAGHTVCRPSRLVYLVGKHTAHTAIAGNNMHVLPKGSVTVTSLLKKAGYHTHQVGKWDAGMATPRHTPQGSNPSGGV